MYNNNNIRFVTLKKTNAKYTVLESREIDRSNGVISDEIVEFTGYQTHKKYPHPLRIIRFFDSGSEKELDFLTNDLDLDAITIAAIYKARWDIELFFKTIKQNLKIKRFIGNSPNAVWTQVWIALIAYLLISYLKFVNQLNLSVQKLFQRIQVNLFERKPLNEIVQNIKYKPPNRGQDNQYALFASLTGHQRSERIKKHHNGQVKSTKNRRPFQLIYFEGCLDRSDALKREKYLKTTYGKRYIKNRNSNFLDS